MGRAGSALKQALVAHQITQNRLAVTLGVDRAVVNRWYHSQVDPNAETVTEIVLALKSIEIAAAAEFIQRYLGDLLDMETPPERVLSEARASRRAAQAAIGGSTQPTGGNP
jgi:transcriptional regulator with XRE-family HTH domain